MGAKSIRDNVALSHCVREYIVPKKKKDTSKVVEKKWKGGVHVVINGFVCRFQDQFTWFEQNGWV
eukprot:SAG11_NODE_41443_length_194_cov_10.126316_1_plen_64_part_11